MGVVRRLPAVEAWLSECTNSWECLTDPEYKALVQDWQAKFRAQVSSRNAALAGGEALDAIAGDLPADILMLSGVQIPEIANLGGSCAAGYRALGLARLDPELLRSYELLVVAPDLSWCCLFSHETGSMFQEQLYGSPGSAA